MNAAQRQRLVDAYPVLADGPPAGWDGALQGADWLQVPRESTGGRRLALYRVTPDEIGVVSTAGLTGLRPLSAHGVAVEPTERALLSREGFERACAHEALRRFVFGVFAERLAELKALAEAVASQRLDQRLAQALLGRGTPIRTTRHALAIGGSAEAHAED